MVLFMSFIYTYSTFLTGTHSFYIAMMKYFFIVHHDTVRRIGETKTNHIFFLVYLIHPLVATIPTVVFFDYEGYNALTSCFGFQQQLLEKYNGSLASLEKMFMCKLTLDGGKEFESDYFF